jgi:hypothetical protein
VIDPIQARKDPKIFGSYIQNQETFGNWDVFTKAAHGMPMTPAEAEICRKFAGREVEPGTRFEQIWCASGRQSRKTLIGASEAIYACLFETFWHGQVKKGKNVFFPIIACDKIQARQCFEYCSGMLNSSPILRREIKRERTWDIEFLNGAVIMIRTGNFRQIRGPQYLGGCFDEVAFLRDSETSANPAAELIKAFLPALIKGGRLWGFSTVYDRQGIFFGRVRDYRGKDDPNVFVWVSDTLSMNPLYDKGKVDRALEEDRVHGLAEYFSEFRDDISSFIPSELIESAVVPGRVSLPKVEGISYVGAVDMSGGRQDSAALGIAHRTPQGRAALDVLLERPAPHSPESVVQEFSAVLKNFDLSEVQGDRYGSEFVVELFRKHGIFYQASERTSSEIFLEFLPMLASNRIELLDSKRLRSQLCGLERRTRSGGRDQVGHYPGGHDDLAVAAAGAVVRVSRLVENFSPEVLARMMFPEPKLSRKEKFDRYVENWLLDRPQEPWKPEEDMDD